MRRLHLSSRTKSIQYLLLLVFSVFMLSACDGGSASDSNSPNPADDNTASPPAVAPTVEGYNALFIGHSFFKPMADGMPDHVNRVGIEGHSQELVFSGGGSGSPQGLWEQPDKRAAIQAILDDGDTELFGMTYHPSYPTLEGYKNWVSYALAQNADTKFFIALPWPSNPASMSFNDYEKVLVDGHPVFHSAIIDALRSEYPDNEFFCIPYGESAVELYRLYDSGNLPDVDTLQSSGGDLGIFRDNLGHPEQLLIDLGQLVWLQAIYQVDLSDYDYDPGYITDIKTIAADIMARNDSAYDDL
jgi:hypothetical protein